MTSPSQLHELVLDRFTDLISPFGFKRRRKRDYAFVKAVEQGSLVIQLLRVYHTFNVDIMLSCSVRIDRVHEFMQSVFPINSISSRELKEMATFGFVSVNYDNQRQLRWTVASVADVESTSRAILDRCKSEVMPFFERFSELRPAFDLFRHDEKNGYKLCPIVNTRCERLLAMAALLDERAWASEFVVRAQNYIQAGEPDKILRWREYVGRVAAAWKCELNIQV